MAKLNAQNHFHKVERITTKISNMKDICSATSANASASLVVLLRIFFINTSALAPNAKLLEIIYCPTNSLITCPAVYCLTIGLRGKRPPASWSRGPSYASPQTPHLPPLSNHCVSDQNINNKVDSTTSVVLSFLNMYVYLPTRRARHHQNMRYDFSFLLGMYMLTCVTSPTIE